MKFLKVDARSVRLGSKYQPHAVQVGLTCTGHSCAALAPGIFRPRELFQSQASFNLTSTGHLLLTRLGKLGVFTSRYRMPVLWLSLWVVECKGKFSYFWSRAPGHFLYSLFENSYSSNLSLTHSHHIRHPHHGTISTLACFRCDLGYLHRWCARRAGTVSSPWHFQDHQGTGIREAIQSAIRVSSEFKCIEGPD
jgi:hypothetical protein